MDQDDWASNRRAFARNLERLARDRGLLSDPVFDESQFRLIDGDVAIDLHNPWHLCGCRSDPDESRLSELITPSGLGEACYLGRVDVVHRLLAAGADPNAVDADGVPPFDWARAACVTTDLHVRVIAELLDGPAVR